MKRKLGLVWAVVLMAGGSIGRAQTTSGPASEPSQTPVSKLTLHAAAAAGNWPKYRLIRSVVDQQPGNAVPLYLLARRSWPDQKTTNEVLEPENHKYDYQDTPIDEFPKQYTQKLLDAYRDTLHYAELGARKRDAKWDDLWDVDWDQADVTKNLRFSYINDLRHVENLLSFRSKYEMSQGDWGAAHRTVQDMLAIAGHLGSEKVLVHKLVGSGFTELALAVSLEEWVGRAGSPNLYWPLTNLPHPIVEMDIYGYYDELASRAWQPLIFDAVEGRLARERWPAAIRAMVIRVMESRAPNKVDPATIDPEIKRLVDGQFDIARRALRSVGIGDGELGAMSREEVVGTYIVREYRDAMDGLWKAFGLPFPEAQAEMMRVWKQIAPQQPPASANPLIRADLVGAPPEYRYPAVLRIRYNLERVDRYVALLRVIEALRDYAAGHDGMPPGKLEDVKDLPVPEDPMTGRAFGYEVKGNVATLDATPPKPFGVFGGWRYELRFVR